MLGADVPQLRPRARFLVAERAKASFFLPRQLCECIPAQPIPYIPPCTTTPGMACAGPTIHGTQRACGPPRAAHIAPPTHLLRQVVSPVHLVRKHLFTPFSYEAWRRAWKSSAEPPPGRRAWRHHRCHRSHRNLQLGAVHLHLAAASPMLLRMPRMFWRRLTRS